MSRSARAVPGIELRLWWHLEAGAHSASAMRILLVLVLFCCSAAENTKVSLGLVECQATARQSELVPPKAVGEIQLTG